MAIDSQTGGEYHVLYYVFATTRLTKSPPFDKRTLLCPICREDYCFDYLVLFLLSTLTLLLRTHFESP